MDKRIALIVGATGTLGKAITNNLISKNIQLILVAKNTDTVSYTHLTLPTICSV